MGIDRYFHVKLRRFQKLNLKPRYAVITSVIIIVSTFVINAHLFFTIKSNRPDSSSVVCNQIETVVTWQTVGKYIFQNYLFLHVNAASIFRFMLFYSTTYLMDLLFYSTLYSCITYL